MKKKDDASLFLIAVFCMIYMLVFYILRYDYTQFHVLMLSALIVAAIAAAVDYIKEERKSEETVKHPFGNILGMALISVFLFALILAVSAGLELLLMVFGKQTLL